MSAADDDEGDVRPMTARGRRTAERLLVASREALATTSYSSLRVEDIVAAAGVSHGTFYTYYENKPDILRALVEQVVARLMAVAGGPWDGVDRLSALERVIGDVLEVYRDEALVIRAWRDAAAEEPELRTRLRALRSAFVARVEEDVLGAVGRDAATPVAAAALVAMVEGYADARLYEDAQPVPHAVAVRALAALWAGGLDLLKDL